MSTVRPPFTSPWVSAGWLESAPAEVVVADVRWYLDGRSGREAYERGHIPGAVFVDLDRDLSAPPTRDGGRHPLPDPEAFAAAMGALGVGDDTPVVAYDDTGGVTAARLWWMLTVLGGPAAVLAGGIAAWDRPLETGAVDPVAVRRRARGWPPEHLVDTGELRSRLGDPGLVVLDARSPERFAGEPHPVDQRYGHVPGARSAPATANLDGSARPVASDVVAARYAALGVADADDVVAYCGSGVSACLDLLVLDSVGLGPGRLYPGSWSAWGADPELPLETGSDPGA